MVNNEWYNKNELRAYPLKDTLALRAQVVDLSLNIQTQDSVYLTYFKMTTDYVTLSIGTATQGLFALTVIRPVYGQTLVLEPLLPNIRGLITLGVVKDTLLEDSILIDPEAVHVTPKTPMYKITKVGNNRDETTGLVELVAGTDIQIEDVSGVITISLKPKKRSKYVPQCSEDAGLTACGYPLIRSINGVTPDSTGRITIEVVNE